MDLPLYELKVSLGNLKIIAEKRGIKGYKSMSRERLLSALSKPKLIKNNFDNERLKKIREDLNKSRHKLSKSEIKEVRRIFTKQRAKKIFQHKK